MVILLDFALWAAIILGQGRLGGMLQLYRLAIYPFWQWQCFLWQTCCGKYCRIGEGRQYQQKKSLLQALYRGLDHLSHIFKCPNSPRVELKPKSVYSMAFRSTFRFFLFLYVMSQSRTVTDNWFRAEDCCILKIYRTEPTDITENILGSLYRRHV